MGGCQVRSTTGETLNLPLLMRGVLITALQTFASIQIIYVWFYVAWFKRLLTTQASHDTLIAAVRLAFTQHPMPPLPNYRPKQLSLGPLESEVLHIVWELGTVAVKDVHDRILSDPERELAYTSVTTILQRLTQKGWLVCNRQNRIYTWAALVTKEHAQALKAYEQLNQFLAVGNPDVVAAFADSLDQSSVDQLEAIAQKLRAVRKAREEQ